ncbi:MAG: Planctomycete cytochrome C [Verrucomicrobia bacterium]|nr:MAG: Planctomycete cytochrome C [Verrucomicrobiota bacterium]
MFKNLKTLTLTAVGLLVVDAAVAQDKIDFATQIYPFVKQSCGQCHRPSYTDERGRTKRPKADLVITTKADFLKGGESGPVIVAGKPDDSPFLQRTLLPLDSDDHQPPQGKAPQWTDAEKALFKKWIEQGADFGAWTEDKTPNDGLEWDGKEFPAESARTAKAG